MLSTHLAINPFIPGSLLQKSLTPRKAQERLEALQTQRADLISQGKVLSPRSQQERKELLKILKGDSPSKSILRVTRAEESRCYQIMLKIFSPLFFRSSAQFYYINFGNDFSSRISLARKQAAQIHDLFDGDSLPILPFPHLEWYREGIRLRTETYLDFFFVLRKIYRSHLCMLVQAFGLEPVSQRRLLNMGSEALLLFRGAMIFYGSCCEIELLQCAWKLSDLLWKLHRIVDSHNPSNPDILSLINKHAKEAARVMQNHSSQIQDYSLRCVKAFAQLERFITNTRETQSLAQEMLLIEAVLAAKDMISQQTSSICRKLDFVSFDIRDQHDTVLMVESLRNSILYAHAMWLQNYTRNFCIQNAYSRITRFRHNFTADSGGNAEAYREVLRELGSISDYLPLALPYSDVTLLMESARQSARFPLSYSDKTSLTEAGARASAHLRDLSIKEALYFSLHSSPYYTPVKYDLTLDDLWTEFLFAHKKRSEAQTLNAAESRSPSLSQIPRYDTRSKVMRIALFNKISRFCSYMPFISSVKGIFDLICRTSFLVIPSSTIANHWYFSHLQVTPAFESFIMLIPVLGNIALYHRAIRAFKAYERAVLFQDLFHQFSKEALKEYKIAAALGHAEATFQCALFCEHLLEQGGIDDQLREEKKQWIMKAALLGFVEAMLLLGEQAEREERSADAVRWYSRAIREDLHYTIDYLK